MDEPTVSLHGPERPPAERPAEPDARRVPVRPRALFVRRATVFAVAAGIVLLLAFDDGGYDLVTRHYLGIAVWAAIALGVAFSVLPRAAPHPAAWVALASMAGLAAYTALALAWTESEERTYAELGRVLQYTGILLLAYLSLNRHTWRAAAAGLAAAALIVPVFSITARLAPDLITDETAQLFSTDRLSYPLGYWNGVAAWGAVAIATGLVWSAHARTTAVRALALVAVPVAALSVYLTYSRAGVIAVVIAVLAAVAFSRNRWTVGGNAAVAALCSTVVVLIAHSQSEIAEATGGGGAGLVLLSLIAAGAACAIAAAGTRAAGMDGIGLERTTAILALTFGFVIVVSAIAPIAHSQIGDAWEEFRNEPAVAVADEDPTSRLGTFGGTRYDAWSAAVEAFETDPARGIGPGTYEFFWARSGEDPQFFRDAHSLYLEQLAELGIPGLVLILLVLAALLAAALVARRSLERRAEIGAGGAAIAAFAVFLFFAGVDWLWELSAVTVLALGGIAVAGTAASRRWGPLPLSTRSRVAIVITAVVAIGIQVPPLVSTERYRAAATEQRSGSLDRAKELADEAVRAEPWAASPYAQRALVLLEQGEFEAARSDLEEAVEREPTNWRHRFLLARVEAEAGKLSSLQQQLDEVERLAPNSVYLIPGHPEREQIDALLSSGSTAGAAAQPIP